MKNYIFITVLLFGLLTQKSTAQSTTASNTYATNDYLGYNSSVPGNPLIFTTSIGITNPQMTLTTNGDLNIIGGGNGYMIGGRYMLWTNNINSTTYLGLSAGNAAATGIYNTFLGSNTGTLTTSGQGNTAAGWGALYNNSGTIADYNTAIGYSTLQNNTTGEDNTAIGANALNVNTDGEYSTAVGVAALYNNTQNNSTACGAYALYSNTTGFGNTGMGSSTLQSNQTGDSNTAMGYGALRYNIVSNNTAMGYGTLLHNITGTLNTAVGVDALYSNLGYGGNIAVGDSALYSQTGSSSMTTNLGNVAVGNSALYGGGEFSTAVGQWAMRRSNGAVDNTALGYSSLYSITNGINNTAGGYESMFSLVTAVENTAFGFKALYSDIHGGDNVAVGEFALLDDLGNANTAVGTGALQGNTIGFGNTSVGNSSLGATTTGSSNTAIGNFAGLNNAGSMNTFLGDSAGPYNTTGYYNTYVGYLAGDGTGFSTVSNTTCLGDYAGFSASAIASNSIYLGNNAITNVYAVPLGFSAYSDRRIKDSIKANVPGLAFINKLQPVTYNLDIHKEASLMNVQDAINWPGKYDVEKIKQSGFIAQAVDSAAQACGYNFSGLGKPQSPGGLYTLGYTTFVVPLVKAVQELSAKNDTLHDSLRAMHSTLDSIRNVLQNIQNCLSQLCGTSGGQGVTNPQNGNTNNNTNSILNTQDITLSGSIGGAPLLYQNAPNPFSTGTTINYYLPQGTTGATIVFYDTYGNMLKTVQLSQTGNGTLNITPDNLSNGIYSYSLIVNGSVIDTKRMLLQK